MPPDPTPTAARALSHCVQVAAQPDAVWALVSDLPGMGRFSPESTGGSWLGGATGPAVGARFAGRNAAGSRRWSTRSTVVRCEPGRTFVFDVRAGGLPVARWSYELQPVDGGCTVTESWQDRRGWLIDRLGGLLTGVQDRTAFTAKSLEQTLAAVKSAAEAAADREDGGSGHTPLSSNVAEGEQLRT